MLQRITLPRITQITQSACDDLPYLLSSSGFRVPLLITDRVTDELGLAAPFRQRLEQHQIMHDQYAGLEVETSMAEVMQGAHKVRAGCNDLYPDPFDCLVALGGNNVINAAKSISLIAANGAADTPADNPGLPIIAIPTTDSVAEITDHTSPPDNGHRLTRHSTTPVAILLDSELIANMTPLIGRATALSTLSYAIEAFTSPNASLFSNQQALAALRLVHNNINTVISQPHQHEASKAMSLAARLAGVAFNATGGNLLFQISHQLSQTFDIEHAISRTMLLAPVIRQLSKTRPEPYAICAATLGLKHAEEKPADASRWLARRVTSLYKTAQLPKLPAFVSEKTVYMTQVDAMTTAVCAVLANDNLNHSAANVRQLYRGLWRN